MKSNESKMKRRWGMAIDLDKCTGCGACAISCAQENNLPIFKDDSDLPKRVAFLELMKLTNDRDAKFPNVEVAFIPKMCQQCSGNDPNNPKPPCVSVCPVVATDVGDDGVVSQIWSRCIGCRYCQASCPYEARVFNWWNPRYEGSFKNSLNPDKSCSSRGAVQKCTFCDHLWKKARDKAVQDGNLDINAVEYTPACASACPTKAIIFGDLADPDSEVSRLAKSDRSFRLVHTIDQKKPEEQAKLMKIKHYPSPKVYYLTSKSWIKDMQQFKKA